jgi:hypothetical protein
MILRLLMGALLVVSLAAPASAQRTRSASGSSNSRPSKGELIPLGGYAWTSSFDVYTGVYNGEFDFEDAGFFGGAIDINTYKGGGKTTQLRLLYRRQSTTAQFRSLALADPIEIDADIEYWHIGGLAGVPRGNALPYATFTLGGTRLVAQGDDVWKFSTMLGLGVKAYTSEKVGIMIQGSWGFTFIDSWGGMAVGTGGASLAIGGTGISQLDVGGGLIIRF